MLHQAGITVFPSCALSDILADWSKQPADLLVTAPDQRELIDVMKRIRHVTTVPVVMLVPGNTLIETEVALFEAGADLVLKRPYCIQTLAPQLRNLAQRGRSIPLYQLRPSQAKGWVVTPSTRTVQPPSHAAIALTQREFELFYLLYTHKGQPLTSDQIIEAIWGCSAYGDSSTLRTLIKQLRRKIEPVIDEPVYLLTVQSVGYQLVLEGSKEN